MTGRFQLVLVKPEGFDFVEGFREVMESMQESLAGLGHPTTISINRIDPDATPIMFGAHHLDASMADRLPADTIVYNLEQLAPGYPWFSDNYLSLLRKCRIWDYSPRNVAFLRREGIAPGARLVPIGYSPCLTRVPTANQDVDVLFFGIQTSRRVAVLSALGQAGLNVVALNNVWGRERDNWIARAKVVLNIHGQDNGEFEIVRIMYLLANRKTVVCEIDDPGEVPEDLRQGIIPATIDAIVPACLAAVRHEGLRRLVGSAGFRAVTRPERLCTGFLRQALMADDGTPDLAPTKEPPRTVGVGTAGRLGDLIASEPVFRHLRRLYPGAKITLVARRDVIRVMAGHPALDELRPIDRAEECFALARSAEFERFHDLNLDGWGCEVSGVVLHKPSEWLPVNGDNYYLFGPLLPMFSMAAGLPPLVDAPHLPVDADAASQVDGLALPPRFLVFHCDSSEAARNWRNEHWVALATRLAESTGLPIFEIGHAASIRTASVSSLCGQLSPLESAELIRRAACFVGIDSGPAHMAIATATPSVVIAGRFRRFEGYFPYTGAFAHSAGLSYLFNPTGCAADVDPASVLAAVHSQLQRSAPGCN